VTVVPSASSSRSTWRSRKVRYAAPNALAGGRAGAEWRRTADHALLQPGLVLADDRAGEAGAIAEPAEDRALAHARLGGDGLHRHARGAVAVEQPCGGVEHEFPVARGIGPLRRLGVELGELEGDADSITGPRSVYVLQ
jgi:hypothetical protein